MILKSWKVISINPILIAIYKIVTILWRKSSTVSLKSDGDKVQARRSRIHFVRSDTSWSRGRRKRERSRWSVKYSQPASQPRQKCASSNGRRFVTGTICNRLSVQLSLSLSHSLYTVNTTNCRLIQMRRRDAASSRRNDNFDASLRLLSERRSRFTLPPTRRDTPEDFAVHIVHTSRKSWPAPLIIRYNSCRLFFAPHSGLVHRRPFPCRRCRSGQLLRDWSSSAWLATWKNSVNSFSWIMMSTECTRDTLRARIILSLLSKFQTTDGNILLHWLVTWDNF